LIILPLVGGLNRPLFKARCQTTAMGIMPHTDIEQALECALSLDIPFWPQLPNVSFYEDMYVQASQNFPGIVVDTENKKLQFDSAMFEKELADYAQKMADPKTFALTESYSVVYHRFLAADLHAYNSIRGQSIGPVSFGFRVSDEANRPIIYNEEVKTVLFDFIQRKVNSQYSELKEKNPNAFVWLDEPGLGWVFSGLSGYSDIQARQDYWHFFNNIEGLRALHLCANVNLPYLLGTNIELLSFDAYQIEIMPKEYVKAIADFIDKGGIISWGIVPTDSSTLDRETPESLSRILTGYWEVVSQNSSTSAKRIAEQALIAPARCCLKNLGQVGATDEIKTAETKWNHNSTVEERVVQKAFNYLGMVSEILRDKFSL